MKKQILTLMVGAAVLATNPAFGMDEMSDGQEDHAKKSKRINTFLSSVLLPDNRGTILISTTQLQVHFDALCEISLSSAQPLSALPIDDNFLAGEGQAGNPHRIEEDKQGTNPERIVLRDNILQYFWRAKTSKGKFKENVEKSISRRQKKKWFRIFYALETKFS